MKLRNLLFSSALILAGSLFSLNASAALLNFDLTYDGTNISLDAGSDTVLGTVLVDGDSFNYNLSAAGNDFWQVDVTDNYFPFVAFTADEVGERSGTYTLDLLLDGISQFSQLSIAVVNGTVHIGTNSVSLMAGLMFDEIVLDYTLISAVDGLSLSTPSTINTTITSYQIGGATPSIPGGFTSGISYNAAVNPPTGVPAPAPLALFGLGIVALGWSKRKTR